MKLRFHSGTLRLRLSQPEVARLAETGCVEDAVAFAPGQVLTYSLESSPANEIAASFADQRIRVAVPAPVAKHWIESDETGITGSSGDLHLLIEKDFQCLHALTEEDPGAFPNPLADKLH